MPDAGVLSLLGATLTLPGIAGIALTIGMAVDANVLIYERIKEDAQRPFAVLALEPAFQRAFGTILDQPDDADRRPPALLASARGRCAASRVTLSIGILTSLFSA